MNTRTTKHRNGTPGVHFSISVDNSVNIIIIIQNRNNNTPMDYKRTEIVKYSTHPFALNTLFFFKYSLILLRNREGKVFRIARQIKASVALLSVYQLAFLSTQGILNE